ncbi:MAG TPA: ATP-binding protein, partial [Desulfomonilaceae bacterium]|nr:ATP-binding protein [Desulfomonilaceae bacterium]
LGGNLAVVNADPDQIGQVLMNLTVNAQQAMPDGGNLTIATANICLNEEYCRSYPEMHPGNYVLLTVSDTGCGMDKETLEHIFEPFFTTKGVGKGTGLGLAMVYGIVRQHGGHVTCHSKPNEGATFKIYLPAIEEDRTERKAEGEQTLPRGGTETILLVDDEDFVRDLGAKFLTRAGYTVLKAASGPEAVELYLREGNRISLIILDIIMPEMGGDKCLEEILAINPDAKIVISSGAAVEGKTKETLESGARGFVSKPFQLRDMLKTVREVLDES